MIRIMTYSDHWFPHPDFGFGCVRMDNSLSGRAFRSSSNFESFDTSKGAAQFKDALLITAAIWNLWILFRTSCRTFWCCALATRRWYRLTRTNEAFLVSNTVNTKQTWRRVAPVWEYQYYGESSHFETISACKWPLRIASGPTAERALLAFRSLESRRKNVLFSVTNQYKCLSESCKLPVRRFWTFYRYGYLDRWAI